MSSIPIVVPTDFTEVSDSALQTAVNFTKRIKSHIELIHIVKSAEKVEALREKLENQKNRFASPSIEINTHIRIGNIFDDIGDAASELGAKFIIMGTHGMKGLQHITGSHALKVITHSSIPFIVVQAAPERVGIDNIVLPFDLAVDTKQKLKFAAEIAKVFKSKAHIIVPNESDEYFKKQVKSNILFAKKYLEEREIDYTVHIADNDAVNFHEDIVDLANDVKADLIAIMNHRKGSLPSFFSEPFEQKLITNQAKVPVLCINPAELTTSFGKYA